MALDQTFFAAFFPKEDNELQHRRMNLGFVDKFQVKTVVDTMATLIISESKDVSPKNHDHYFWDKKSVLRNMERLLIMPHTVNTSETKRNHTKQKTLLVIQWYHVFTQ